MAKPIKSVELHRSMIQFLIMHLLLLLVLLVVRENEFQVKTFLPSYTSKFLVSDIHRDIKNEKSVCAQIYFKVQHT